MTGSEIDETFESPPRSLGGLAKAIAQGRTAMMYESPPLDGSARAAGFLDIRGWAYSHAGLDGVSVYLDGLRYQARLSVPRPDLNGLDGLFGADLTRSGFDLTIELDADQVGRLAVSVVARGADGHAVGVRGVVECRPEPELPVTTGGRQDGAEPVGETFEASALGGAQRCGVPAGSEVGLLEAEHDARYGWAAGLVRDREVLDAGCGLGQGSAALAAAGARQVVGVDISNNAVRAAREQFGDVAEFVVGDLAELAFDDDSFDVVACFETIAQVGDPEGALNELRRILRPEGVLLISAPNGALCPARTIELHEHQPDGIAEALRRRFSGVRLYHQQSHVVSLVGDEASFAEPVGEQDLVARVHELAGGRLGEKLDIVAAASDAELPGMDTMVSIGAPLQNRSWHDLVGSLQERVLIAEAETATSAADARAAMSWRITRPLRLAPRMLGPARHALGVARRSLRRRR